MPITRSSSSSSSSHKASNVATTFCCNLCDREFSDERACTTHMRSCAISLAKLQGKPRISSSAIISRLKGKKKSSNNTTTTYSGSVSDLNEKCTNAKVLNVDDHENAGYENHDAFVDVHNELESNSDVIPNLLENASSAFLLNQESAFQKRMQFTHQLWSNESVGKLELLKILDRHNCPNSVYKEVMGWAHHYAIKRDCKIFVDSDNVRQRNVALKELQYRRDMKGMEPQKVNVNIGFNNDKLSNVEVTVFDFKNQVLSMLRDEVLMDSTNLAIDESVLTNVSNNVAVKDGSNQSYVSSEKNIISEINDSDWYKWAVSHYNKKLGVNPNRIVCGVILTMDKTHTDNKGKLCLEPVQFSLSIFNTDTRKRNGSAWKCLGFINDLDSHIYSKHHLEVKEKLFKKLNLSTSNMKSLNYHRILSSILKSLKDVQKDGLFWNLKLSSGNYHRVQFMFPVCLCVVDMKGGRQLCGRFESPICKEPSLSCTCSRDLLQNSTFKCKPVLDHEMKKVLKNVSDTKEYEKKLNDISSHYCPKNAFFDLDLCEWPYGIWGLCPSEILHQYYEGVLLYMLDEFLKEFLPTSFFKNLEKSLQKLLVSVRDQSGRDIYPSGVFSLGMLKTPRTKGIEKFACVFYLALFLHTSLGKSQNFEGKKPISDKDFKDKLLEWRRLFETCCYYNDWLCGASFPRTDLEGKHKRIIGFHQTFKKLIKRQGHGINNIPKFHEFFHIVRNIKRHGPPTGYSTITTEGIHHSVKEAAKHTSHHVESFPFQTGKRMYERSLIQNAYRFVGNFAKSLYHKNKLKKKKRELGSLEKSGRSNKNNRSYLVDNNPTKPLSSLEKGSDVRKLNYEESDINGIGLFFIIWNNEDKSIKCVHNVNDNESYIQNNYISESKPFLKFIETEIIRCLEGSSNRDIHISCYTSVFRNGYSFRGLSRDLKNHPGWAIFQYEDEDGNCYAVPGKVLTFLNLSNCKFQEKFSDKYETKEMHVILESLTDMPEERVQINRHSSICKNVEISSDKNKVPRIWCVSINCILDVAYVIPDLGNLENPNKYLYVFPRYECLDDSMMLDAVGWANKF